VDNSSRISKTTRFLKSLDLRIKKVFEHKLLHPRVELIKDGLSSILTRLHQNLLKD
jgi:hypothetical protein